MNVGYAPTQFELAEAVKNIKAQNSEMGIKRVHAYLKDKGWCTNLPCASLTTSAHYFLPV